MSLVNKVMGEARGAEPEVGMGGTVCHWSDRDAVTIIEVKHFQSGERKGEVSGVVVQYDKTTRTDQNGHTSEAQEYTYEPRPDSPPVLFKKNKEGRFVMTGGGSTLAIGYRETYRDINF